MSYIEFSINKASVQSFANKEKVALHNADSEAKVIIRGDTDEFSFNTEGGVVLVREKASEKKHPEAPKPVVDNNRHPPSYI